MLKGMGKFVLQSAWSSIKAEAIKNALSQLEIPDLRISEQILESLNSWLKQSMAYRDLFKDIERGAYIASKELLVSDALAIISVYYPTRDITIIGKEPEQVLEELTSIVLDNWNYLSDPFKLEVWQFMVDGVYRMNRITERTHFSYGPPRDMTSDKGDYRFRILIILDCINRLDSLTSFHGLSYSYSNSEHSDEMSYLRSGLKEPRKNWQRGQYDWSKDKDRCWIVTAYYGDENHPNVRTIRYLKEFLIAHSKLSRIVVLANKIYQRIGQSGFGHWWCRKVKEKRFNLPRFISAIICTVLINNARLYRRTYCSLYFARERE